MFLTVNKFIITYLKVFNIFIQLNILQWFGIIERTVLYIFHACRYENSLDIRIVKLIAFYTFYSGQYIVSFRLSSASITYINVKMKMYKNANSKCTILANHFWIEYTLFGSDENELQKRHLWEGEVYA